MPERAQRPVSYASKQELEQAIFRRHHAQRAESDTPPVPPVRGGMAYAQNKRMRQESPPPASLRTDLEDK